MIDRVARSVGLTGRRGVLLVIVLVGLAFYAGMVFGGVQTHTGVAQSNEFAITIQTDDWAYNAPLELTWYDAGGLLHLNGRPDCLPPTDTERSVTFGSVDVSFGGISWREVVWVDCRQPR